MTIAEGSRKKVMWLIKGLGAGGAEKLLATALPYIDRDSFEYEVAYFLPWKQDLVPEFKERGIPVFCIGIGKSYDPRAGFRLARLLRERCTDILHIHSPYAGIIGRLAGRLAGVSAIVYTEHSMIDRGRLATRVGNLLTYPINDATIAVSEAVRRSVSRWRMARPGTLQTIHQGIDVKVVDTDGANPALVKEGLGIDPSRLVVGNVANIRPVKGQAYLLKAARLVLREVPQATFVIVGREKSRTDLLALQKLTKELGIGDGVIFTGFRRDALQLMAAFDVFVLSSLYEGLPVALLEAMALGKTPVATRVGGIPEVIEDGVDGFLVEPRDPEQLAGRILRLLGDEALRSAMGERGRRKVRDRFDIERAVKAVEQVYVSTLRGKGS